MSKLNKEHLRKKYLDIRKEITNKEEKSKEIASKVQMTEEFQNANIIALYKSLPSEVDTSFLIEDALQKRKVVVLPRVYGNEMKFYQITSSKETFEKSKFGIEEPIENEENFIEASRIDLMIVPGICFDKENNRLGFGKGYYDRFLENTKIKTIGICYQEQLLEKDLILTDQYDVKMQQVITNDKQ